MTTPAQHKAVARVIAKWFRYQHELANEIYADEIIAAFEAAAWQPMITAPKDGTEILTWNGAGYFIVSWRFGEWQRFGKCVMGICYWRPLAPPKDPTP